MCVVTTDDDLLAVACRELGPSSRWTLTLQRDVHGFVLVADHPASAGLVIETGTLDHDLAARRISSWIRQAISPGVRRALRTRPRTRAANHDGALPVGTADEAHPTTDLAYPSFCADEL